jgi:multidrug efflux pump
VIPRFFVDRPIFATVLSVILTLAGAVAAFTLPVSQYPEIAPPTVEVSAIFPGANATIVADTVAAPIEQQVNGVEDMMYMSSQCTNDGGYALTVTFKPGTDLNVAQVLVQNRVNLAQPVLPDLVKRRGVSVKKKSPAVLLIVNLISPDGSKDDLYLSNYATIQLRDELARVTGVGDITVLGQRDYAMRVWLDPEKMASRGLSAMDVVRAIEQQNAQVAAGQLGQPPSPNAVAFQFTLNTLGRLTDASQFEDVILKVDGTSGVTRLKDVGRIELAAATYDQSCTLDGQPSVALSVYQLPGSNAIATAERVKARLDELRNRLPAGVETVVAYDTTPFVRESVSEVFAALRDAVLLVAGVMLAFLRTWRTTLVPLVAVPVAIVGTFAAMAAFGYGLNSLTLFGLVLAVGIVVDDAIVVVEAVEHHMALGLSPREATIKAMDQVAGPVIAVGLVLAAVFVPCLFVSGVVGQFFRQFAVTIAISTLISAFNSLTLSPALCALLLKPHAHGHGDALPRILFPVLGAAAAYFWLTKFAAPWIDTLPAEWQKWMGPVRDYLAPILAGLIGAGLGWFVSRAANRLLGLLIAGFNAIFQRITSVYLAIVSVMLYLTPLVLLAYGGLIIATGKVLDEAPVGFIPTQDKGYLLVNLQMPDATSIRRTTETMARADVTARSIPGVRHTIAVAGQSVLLGAAAPNFGSLYVMLDDFEHRRSPDRSADAIAAKLRAAFAETHATATVTVFGAPPVDGLGTAGGFKLVLLDPAGTAPAEVMDQMGQEMVAQLVGRPEIRDAVCGFRANSPWLYLDVDRVQAAESGVGVGEIASALQVYFGTFYVNDFNRFGRTWQVTLQADGGFRQTAADLLRLGVKNESGQMVPLRSFATIREATGPILIQRYNLYPSVSVNLTPAPGISSGQTIRTGNDVAATVLPPTLRAEWTELALLQLETGNTPMIAFALSVVLVFLVLAAQYESWVLPLAVILVVPLCLLWAAVGVLIAGLDVNVFTQVGFVVLVGLAGKNAILIVEFARTRHRAGASVREATRDACRLRFRPIVMTSVAFILGVVPLLTASGAGAEMRKTLGTAVFAGMIGVTLFGVFLTPAFFFAIQWLVDCVKPRPKPTND